MNATTDKTYFFTKPRGTRLPILISCPHSGTEIPVDIGRHLDPNLAREVPDTDFFVHELYGFASELGIGLISARYSRYVVDLNRAPDGKRLYTDGRVETGLVPLRTFAQQPLYLSQVPDAQEVQRRIVLYYEPYHQAVEQALADLHTEFPQVLLYEAHSIRRMVPSINLQPFPDMIVGDQKGQTADPKLSNAALAALRQGGFQVAHNEPFMGGFLTRKFGQPARKRHAIQLEMSQDIYMNESACAHDPTKMNVVQRTLRATLLSLGEAMVSLR